MKIRLLITIGIVLASVVISSVYVVSVQNRCESLLGDTHYPHPMTFWNCFDYLQKVDNPPPQSSTSEHEPSHVSSRLKIEGKIADQICAITGGDCPSYYIGNIQDDGSVMVGMTFSDTVSEKQFIFFIKNNTLSYEVKENENIK